MNGAGLLEAVRALGLIAPTEVAALVPLSGGVSSDVYLVRASGGREWVIKRSIPRLRVKADWRAPLARDAPEVAWLETVRGIDPDLAPEVLAWSPEDHLFVMARRDGMVWKEAMAAGQVDSAFAGQVGRAMARIHAASAGRADVAARFPDPSNFFALRIDPFLLFVADRHPDVAARVRTIAADLQARRSVLVWGDASPKNILVGAGGPVFLDAETAAMGDPAFDLAFCLTHLFLKTLWLAPHAATLMDCVEALRDAYLAGFAADKGFNRRVAGLIGALLLARVDGKSPAGYLSPVQDEIVRRRAKAILVRRDLDLIGLADFWRAFA